MRNMERKQLTRIVQDLYTSKQDQSGVYAAQAGEYQGTVF